MFRKISKRICPTESLGIIVTLIFSQFQNRDNEKQILPTLCSRGLIHEFRSYKSKSQMCRNLQIHQGTVFTRITNDISTFCEKAKSQLSPGGFKLADIEYNKIFFFLQSYVVYQLLLYDIFPMQCQSNFFSRGDVDASQKCYTFLRIYTSS